MSPVTGAPAPAPPGERRFRRRLREGHPDAIDDLYREYQPRLLSYCRHMLGNLEEAEDAVQLTFLAAHVQLPHEPVRTSLGAWLFTVARRRSLDIIRRRGHEEPLTDREPATAGLAAEVERRADLRNLVAELQRLDDTHRSALVLTQLEALSQADVARVMGIEEPRVRRLVFEARQTLLDRRDARDLVCRDVQEELANARGSQLRRRHLVSHCEQCGECEEFRTALLAQRTALRAVLPVVPFLLMTRKAWASGSVPRPRPSVPGRLLRAVGGAGAPALTTLATVLTLAVIAGLPQTAPVSLPSRPAAVTDDGPGDTRADRSPRRVRSPQRSRDAASAGPIAAPARVPAVVAQTAVGAQEPSFAAAAGPGPAAGVPAAEPARPAPQITTTTPTTPTTTPVEAPPVAIPQPPVTVPEDPVIAPPPTVTEPPPVELPPKDKPCTGDNNGNGNGEGCTPNPDPNGPGAPGNSDGGRPVRPR